MIVSDFFVEFETVYQNGITIKGIHNFAMFSNISETRDYFILTVSGVNTVVPKFGIPNHEILRQIFLKEMGTKLKYFPDK